MEGGREEQTGQKAVEHLLRYHTSTTSMTAKQMKEYRRSIMAKNYW